MKASEFNKIVNEVCNHIKSTLCIKAQEYALNDDRLEAFKRGGSFLNCDAGNALLGMLNKHIVSIFTMVQDGGVFPIERWDEKVTDAINYLILLLAIKYEEIKNAQH